MKTRFVLFMTFLLGMSVISNAQDLAYTGRSVKETVTAPNVVKTVSPIYHYSVYGEIPVAETLFEEEHFLGSEVTLKWNTFLKNYTHEYSVEVGLSDSGVEYMKPSVYNAVERVNSYLRKSIKKGLFSRDKAVEVMVHILDCANVICFESDTEEFEKAAKSVKSGEEVIQLFEQVELVRM